MTVYEAVGGDATFERIVVLFYAGVERDPLLRPLYPDDLGPGQAPPDALPHSVLRRSSHLLAAAGPSTAPCPPSAVPYHSRGSAMPGYAT